MGSLLLRSRKDAFEVIAPDVALDRNIIGDNSGNLIFLEAAQRLLTTRGQSVTPDRFVIDPAGAERINERYDGYVIPLANAFRPSYEANLIRLTQLIERLRIPVTILGVGAQANVRYSDAERLRPMEPSIRRFVSAVLERGPSIGVRGEFTASYLEGLGFRDVDVIGCPSLFLYGDGLRVTKRVPALAPDARVAINISPYVKAMAPIARRHVARYPELIYVPQDLGSLERLVSGGAHDPAAADAPVPDERARFFLDPWPWIAALRDVDVAFGSRIHGNIAALLAGTPAIVLAHDSRTLEIARYFDIPHRILADLPADIDVAELYAAADFDAFHAGQPGRFATFTAFLARHGLDHAFAPGEDPAAFLDRLSATPFPPAVTIAERRPPSGVVGRLRALRRRVRRAVRSPRMRTWRAAILRRRT
ncbi:MAG TPA: polysaccharide pyruvyl transferase family protein [Candidatus Saccharimonadales bacterium]|nr:polysaccharide pyruvyl transferase family protein [Candidatus Saccharimonadales bacterium]